MKILVTYWSKTGNTKKVAEAIFDALPGEKAIAPMDGISNPEDYNLVFAGFPVMQFSVPAAVKKFAKDLAPGRKVALFVTHAMPPDPADAHQQELLERELARCRSAFAQCDMAGLFHCQGELSEQVAGELMASSIASLRAFAAMRPQTIGHPDGADLERAGAFAKGMTRNP